MALLAGCGAPGPRALLKGERLIKEREFNEAIEQLQAATQMLPRNPQAWNHLGLAYHGAGQLEQAQKAYKEALRLDFNLAAVRYNLGSLALEQNDPIAAIEHLASYTAFQPASAEGWIKLGNAQARARRLDQAEKSYKNALDIRPRDPEALNGLGTIAYHRRKLQEAGAFFNSALGENPRYAPAVLNAAIVHHAQDSRQKALEEFKQYVALAPSPAMIDAVNGTIEQLESQFTPAPPAISGIALPKTNVAAPQITRPAATTAPPPIVVIPPRSNPPPAIAAAARTNRVSPPAPTTAGNRAATPRQRAETAADLQVTQLEDDLVVKPVQDLASAKKGDQSGVPVTNNSASAAATNDEKRSLIARLNPFSGRPKPGTNVAAAIPAPAPSAVAATPPAPVPTYPRYRYTSRALPKSGNRREAERHFSRGVAAQKSAQLAQALAHYQQAASADPAYFEAYYNLGLAAYDLGQWRQSLGVYELALALKPDSIDTRYNFALALKQAGHPLDAMEELKRILKANPAETRAHLSLGNLYAQQLNQPRAARPHYLKVIETEPNHPKASEIRYWLAANP